MATFYTQYQIPQAYNTPVIVNEWSPLVNTLHVQSSYITVPVPHIPVAIVSPQILTTICPYTVVSEPLTNTILDNIPDVYSNVTPEAYNITSDTYNHITPDIYSNISPDTYSNVISDVYTNIPDIYCNVTPSTYSNLNPDVYANITSDVYNNVCPEAYSNVYTPYKPAYTEEEIVTEDCKEEMVLPEQVAEAAIAETERDPVEFFLTLPKELFPPAKTLNIDPNAIIDEFCKLPNINENVSWILDIEFGVPRVPVTRSIAVYNVKFNSIHCKNTPNAIHPGFEKCNSDFKKAIVFYYDCVVSIWYRGYIILNYDKSVENFQSWLLIPMQIFGMCWP